MHSSSNKADIFNYQPLNMPKDGVLMGIKREPSRNKEVHMTRKELALHVYILGQTGVGKTTLLQTMIVDQIMARFKHNHRLPMAYLLAKSLN